MDNKELIDLEKSIAEIYKNINLLTINLEQVESKKSNKINEINVLEKNYSLDKKELDLSKKELKRILTSETFLSLINNGKINVVDKVVEIISLDGLTDEDIIIADMAETLSKNVVVFDAVCSEGKSNIDKRYAELKILKKEKDKNSLSLKELISKKNDEESYLEYIKHRGPLQTCVESNN